MLSLSDDSQVPFPKWKQVVDDDAKVPSTRPHGLLEFERYGQQPLHAFVSCSEDNGLNVVQIIEAESLSQKFEAFSYQEHIWKSAVESAGHGVWDYNSNNEVMFVSDEWKRIRGFPVSEPVKDSYETWIGRLHPDDVADTIEHVRLHNQGEVEKFSFEYRERHTGGHYVWILCHGRVVERTQDGKAVRITGTDIDISKLKHEEQLRLEEADAIHARHVAELEEAHARTEAARQIAHLLARQDPLTQLPNRRVFSEEIANLAEAGEHQSAFAFAVMIIDLDRFKPVNDLYGHEIGDAVISDVAKRLLAAAGPDALVARIGGDEFGVILRSTGTAIPDAAHSCAEAIIRAAEKPIHIGDLKIEIGASIGIATYPEDGMEQKTLFRNADMALYVVKQGRRGRYVFYSDSMGQAAETKATLDSTVRRAVVEGLFEPYFQPIIDLKTGEIKSLEVLARLNDPHIGFVPPSQFIEIIEQSQLMPQFTESMLRKSFVAAKDWPTHISLSVNLSAREVCSLATPIKIFKLAASVGFPLSRLTVEATEQALMKDMFIAKQVVAAFRRSGIRVSLDDFGAGYAGLGYLRELVFDSIKIDRSFVATLLRQEESRKIVEAMQALATNLGLETIAEGVEDEITLQAIKKIGCCSAQGYFFSRPVPASEIPAVFNSAAFIDVRRAKRS